jgi:hypothetical protein
MKKLVTIFAALGLFAAGAQAQNLQLGPNSVDVKKVEVEVQKTPQFQAGGVNNKNIPNPRDWLEVEVEFEVDTRAPDNAVVGELLFINGGKIIHHGSAESLRKGSAESTIVNVQLIEDSDKLREWAELSPNVKFIDSTKQGGRIEIDSIEEDIIAGVLRRMINSELPVTEFHQEERKLEDAFIEILGEIEASGEAIVN